MPNNPLSVFHDLLFLGLRPWNNRSLPEAKFKELVREVNNEVYNHQPKYKVAFSNPLNAKRKYYSLIIANGAIHFLNHLKNEVDAALNDNERLYLVAQQAIKPLAQKLKEANNIIEERQLHWSEIKGTAHLSISDAAQADEAYIIQLVKYNLLFMYLEIQNSFPQFLNDDALSADELHQKFFTEQELQSDIIINADQINLPTPASQVKADPHAITFERKAFDFNDPPKGVLPYTKVVRNEQRFAAFEEELFLHNLIDKDYNFIDDHGNKQLLAAAIQAIIAKNYFLERNFVKLRAMQPVDIRKFIDHRYTTSIDKQFRNWSNDTNALAQFLDNHFWITNLPADKLR